nr:hypothetical protein [Tanacetum cinerariifolium]
MKGACRRHSTALVSPLAKTVQGKPGPSKDFELNFFQDGSNANSADATSICYADWKTPRAWPIGSSLVQPVITKKGHD